jgi:hypothetical protein
MSIVDEIAKRKAEQTAQSADSAVNQAGLYIPSTAIDTQTQNANQALAASNEGAKSGTNIMDPAALIKGQPVVNVKLPTPTVSAVVASTEDKQAAAAKVPEFRTFKHIYAGAKTHMPNGKEIRFGGHAGSPGFFATNKTDEIDYLTSLSDMPGSQVTEVDRNEHKIPFYEDLEEARTAAQGNSVRAHDPRVAAAQENIEAVIAADVPRR